MTFETVFDASRQSHAGDILLAVLFPIVGCLAFASGRLRRILPFGLHYLVPVLSLLPAVVIPGALLLQHRLVDTDLSTGHYTVAEGPVSDYVRYMWTRQSYRPGGFTVQGHRFGLPNYVVFRGFDNAGQPVAEGRVARITYDGTMILRVEIGQGETR